MRRVVDESDCPFAGCVGRGSRTVPVIKLIGFIKGAERFIRISGKDEGVGVEFHICGSTA